MVTAKQGCRVINCEESGRCQTVEDCTPCPKGEYNNNTKQAKCQSCEAGYYNE